jgi:DNA mismatch endonuclease (patch repair protein)
MADVFSKAKRSQVMAAIRSSGNKDTELKFAAILRAAGISGWRRKQPLPGRPDFVFRQARLAVFIDGCFWHGCPEHGRKPDTNRTYWMPKLRRNRRRDVAVTRELVENGWTVLRFWEHQLKKPGSIVKTVQLTLARLHRTGK